jgi:hypothetical protein
VLYQLKVVRNSVILLLPLISTLDVMLSGPAAMYGFKFDSNFAIPFSVMFRSCILGEGYYTQTQLKKPTF